MGAFEPFHRDDGRPVRLVQDPWEFNYYIDAAPGYTAPQLAAVLRQAREVGLDVFDVFDEDDGDVLPDGTVRIWLTPVDVEAKSNPLVD